MTLHIELLNSGSFSQFHKLKDNWSVLFFPTEEVIIVEQIKRWIHWSLVLNTSCFQAPLWEKPWENNNKKRLIRNRNDSWHLHIHYKKRSNDMHEAILMGFEKFKAWMQCKASTFMYWTYHYQLGNRLNVTKSSQLAEYIALIYCFTKRIFCRWHFPCALSFMY